MAEKKKLDVNAEKQLKETTAGAELEVRSEKSKENNAEEQLKEMEKVVEEKEKKEDEKVSKEFDKKAKVEEKRGGYRGKFNGPRESWEDKIAREHKEKLERWIPRTELGRAVRAGKVTDIDVVLSEGRKIMEPEIVDLLIPSLKSDTLFIGQAKGKFGGGKRRPFRQTQKKTKEGSVLTFGVMAVVGDGKGHVGIGYGRAAETLPAKEKAFRKAKLNITKINLGCASFDCNCEESHSIPVAVKGKCSSVVVELMPAPQGTGLVVNDELKKILRLVGIKDVYSKTAGKVRTTFNSGKACMDALNKIGEIRI